MVWPLKWNKLAIWKPAQSTVADNSGYLTIQIKHLKRFLNFSGQNDYLYISCCFSFKKVINSSHNLFTCISVWNLLYVLENTITWNYEFNLKLYIIFIIFIIIIIIIVIIVIIINIIIVFVFCSPTSEFSFKGFLSTF